MHAQRVNRKPRPTPVPRALWRLLRGVWHVGVGVFTVWLAFPRWSPARREARVQSWSREFLALWGVELRVIGEPVVLGPALMVCNHISWLDILVLHAVRHCRFVAKSGIRRWPVIGMLAHSAGTLFIERERRSDARRMVHDMSAALQAGDVLAVFPEGTTGAGEGLLPFHANLLESALRANAPVQPVYLQFMQKGQGRISHAADYVGDDTLMASIWRLLRAPAIEAVLHFAPLQTAQGRHRREWAQDLREQMGLMQEAWLEQRKPSREHSLLVPALRRDI